MGRSVVWILSFRNVDTLGLAFLFDFYKSSFCEMTESLFSLHFSKNKSFAVVIEVLLLYKHGVSG